MLPISVFIIARDEADRIPCTINSVRDWADEVIVIDSGSTDDTVKVSESLGARVVFNAWKGYGPQKIFGESLCRNRWLLNLDADEEISPELAREIQALFADGEPREKGYWLRILALYRFQKKLPPFAAGTKQLRLYDKTYAGFRDSTVHDTVIPKTAPESERFALPLLAAPVVHRCFRSYTHAVAKINFYSGEQAQDLFRKGTNPPAYVIILTPLLTFLKCYFLRKYVLYGLDGFIQSCIYAFSRTIRLAKARELFQEAAEREN
jgi:glycosyltransferase involved in cell wall biosynthesis